jgi:hypothetical protein
MSKKYGSSLDINDKTTHIIMNMTASHICPHTRTDKTIMVSIGRAKLLGIPKIIKGNSIDLYIGAEK